MTIDELTREDSGTEKGIPISAIRDTDRQGGGGENSGGRRREPTSFYYGVITGGLLAGALYFGYQTAVKEITHFRIYDVQMSDGKDAAKQYALDLWKEIHPQKETWFRNIIYHGKKRGVLDYLGYKAIEELQQRQQPTTSVKPGKDSL